MDVLTTDGESAAHRGVHEVALRTDTPSGNPYRDIDVEVRFERPDGSTVTVDGFYDGDGTYRARAYCDALGEWRWESDATDSDLVAAGSFVVRPSSLPGKLRQHTEDPRQLRYDSGEWFLHVGDTGYRYPVDTEPEWRDYVDGAVSAGATKIRTWFARSRYGVEALFADESRESGELNLDYWQEIDRRYRYALEEYPHLQFQVVPYAEDGEALRAYPEDPTVRFVGRHVQARFAAFPTVHWCVVNDAELVEGEVDPDIVERGAKVQKGLSKSVVEAMGRDFHEREPWGTLLTSHQQRTTGYDFADAEWSDLVTLQDIDQASGERVREYRERSADPVIVDEDRYERYRGPDHPRYFFRRLLWATLLSGGHPTYGGNRTFEPHDGDERGVRGYDDSGLVGMDDVVRIHSFFEETGISLVGLSPDAGVVAAEPERVVCCHDDRVYVAYFANPADDDPETAAVRNEPQSTSLDLPAAEFAVRWYDPTTGEWTDRGRVEGGRREFTTPAGGDWVLVLGRVSISAGT